MRSLSLRHDHSIITNLQPPAAITGNTISNLQPPSPPQIILWFYTNSAATTKHHHHLRHHSSHLISTTNTQNQTRCSLSICAPATTISAASVPLSLW